MPEPRFLVVRLGSLGDIIHTFPAVAALRESFPRASIIWLTHPRWSFLVQTSGLASEVWAVETRTLSSLRNVIRRLRQNSWSAAIDYQGLWKSAMLPFLGGVTRRIGFSSTAIREFGVPLLYTERVETSKAHIAEQNGDLSLHAGAQRRTAPVNLQIPERDQVSVCSLLRGQRLERYVVLSPGGGWRSKCWPAERFGALTRKLWESAGLRCVVNAGPGDNGRRQTVCLQRHSRRTDGALERRGLRGRRRYRTRASCSGPGYACRRTFWSDRSRAEWSLFQRRGNIEREQKYRVACFGRAHNSRARPANAPIDADDYCGYGV